MQRGVIVLVGALAVVLAAGALMLLAEPDGLASPTAHLHTRPPPRAVLALPLAGDAPAANAGPVDGRPDPSLLDGLDLDAVTATEERPPPTPEAQAWQARLQEPDAIWYGATASAWRAIQRELHRAGSDPALVEDVAALVEQLRGARRAPDRADLALLQDAERAMRERLDNASHGVDLSPLTQALSRHDARLASTPSP